MAVINLWHGAMGPTGFTVVAKVTGAAAQIRIGTSNPPSGVTVNATPVNGVARFNVTGLSPDTDYFYGVAVDGVLDPASVSQTRTFPAAGAAASFRFAASSCAGHYNGGVNGGTTFWPPDAGVTDVSNAKVFDHIRVRRPLMFVHMGDLHYRDITDNDPDQFRLAYDDVLSAPRQAALYRSVPIAYTWDDHDFGPNDADSTSPTKPAAVQAYRERVPHYPLSDPEGVWQAWSIGRVRFIMTDNRSQSTPYSTPEGPGKWYLGPAQEAWLEAQLTAATEPLIVLVFPSPWHINGNYASERERLGAMIAAHGLTERMIIISGDWHGLGFDTGKNNTVGGCPVFQVSPLDSSPSGSDFPEKFDHGTSRERGQWAMFDVEDNGKSIRLSVTGYINGTPKLSLVKRFFSRFSLVEAVEVRAGGETIGYPQVAYKGDLYPVQSIKAGQRGRYDV